MMQELDGIANTLIRKTRVNIPSDPACVDAFNQWAQAFQFSMKHAKNQQACDYMMAAANQLSEVLAEYKSRTASPA